MPDTSSPRLKVLFEVINEIKSGKDKITDLKEIVNIIRTELGDLAGMDQDETIFSDETSKSSWEVLKASIVDYQKALEKISAYFESKNAGDLDEGLSLATVADNSLYEIYSQINKVYQKMKDELESKDKVVCLKCGHESHKDDKFCQKCNQPLPKVFKEVTEYADISGAQLEAAYGEVEEYENIKKLRLLVDGILEGKEEPSKFIEYVEGLKKMYESAQRQFDSIMRIRKNLFPEVLENVKLSREVISDFIKNFDKINSLAVSQNFESFPAILSKIEELADELGDLRKNFQTISQSLASAEE